MSTDRALQTFFSSRGLSLDTEVISYLSGLVSETNDDIDLIDSIVEYASAFGAEASSLRSALSDELPRIRNPPPEEPELVPTDTCLPDPSPSIEPDPVISAPDPGPTVARQPKPSSKPPAKWRAWHEVMHEAGPTPADALAEDLQDHATLSEEVDLATSSLDDLDMGEVRALCRLCTARHRSWSAAPGFGWLDARLCPGSKTLLLKQVFDFLQTQFPGLDPALLYEVYESSGFDVWACLEAVQGLASGSSAPAAATDVPQQERLPQMDDVSAFPALSGSAQGTAASAASAPRLGGSTFAAALRSQPAAAAPPSPQSAAATPARPAEVRSGPKSSYRSDIQWVSTGDQVARTYAELRELVSTRLVIPCPDRRGLIAPFSPPTQASYHARARNTCYMQATQAFMAGNKALAKELSAQGRWHRRALPLWLAVVLAMNDLPTHRSYCPWVLQ